jgi:hypothetical protein
MMHAPAEPVIRQRARGHHRAHTTTVRAWPAPDSPPEWTDARGYHRPPTTENACTAGRIRGLNKIAPATLARPGADTEEVTSMQQDRIPYGYCQCGCGEKTTLAPTTNRPRGWVAGEPVRYVSGHHRRGKGTSWQTRFWRFVTLGDPAHCWEWTGSREGGYGRFRQSNDRRAVVAHRASFELHFGPIPDGLLVCHRCDNPACVNPAHLFLGTQTDNMRDAAQKGRTGPQRHGAQHRRKLSDADVRTLRERAAAGEAFGSIASSFGIHPNTVSTLATGKKRVEAGGPLTRRAPSGTIDMMSVLRAD